jgi:NADH-quinone oxidoreductase subunit J
VTPLGLAFYVAGAFVLATTAVAVTRRDPVHAVVWLIASFLGTALVFALLGATVLAALQVILYAGGILVLFLFVVLAIRPEPRVSAAGLRRRAIPALIVVAGALGLTLLVASDPAARSVLVAATASPRALGELVFGPYALAVEVASLLLFVPLVGALALGRSARRDRVRGEDVP